MAGATRPTEPEPAMFDPSHRAALERWAASGCPVSRYMLDHNVWFPEALEALHRERCADPVPVPEDLD